MKIKIMVLLLWVQIVAAQKAPELMGLTGKIEKIEQLDYMDAEPRNGKWHIGKNNFPKRTEKTFDRDSRLLSIGYVEDKIKIKRVYHYNEGKMARVERLDSIGNVQDVSSVVWTDNYTAVAKKMDNEGNCICKLYWHYNADLSLDTFIITNNCSDKSPEDDVRTKAIYHYDANGFNNRREIFVQEYNYLIFYDVIEKDSHGNPLAVVERQIDAAGNNEIQTLTLYRYTYFNEKPGTESYKNVVLAENADRIFDGENENAGQSRLEEQKQEVSDSSDWSDRYETVAPVLDEACVNHNKYSAKQRLKFYPFNKAKKVALISYKDAAVEAELYPANNGLPDLERADKVVELNSGEIDDLTNTIYNIGYAEPVFIKTLAIDCPAVKNAIVFLDGRGKPFEYILLYFGCNEYGYSSEKVEDGDYCAQKFDLLKAHFTAKGIPTAP